MTATARMAGMEDLDLNLLPQLRSNPVALLDYALALPERIAAADGKRMSLFIDEFQTIERIGDNHAYGWALPLKQKIRTTFQRSTHTSFLFAGSLEHMMKTIFGNPDDPFFNFGTFHRLGPILPEEWRAGLLSRFEKSKTRIDSSAIDLIVNKGFQHPRATMLIAQRAHILSIINGAHHVTLGLAEAAYLDALQSERQKHEAWVERVQDIGSAAINRVALRSLVSIAKQGAPYAGARYPLEVHRALKVLNNAGFIEKEGKQRWKIIDPLFQSYLSSLDMYMP